MLVALFYAIFIGSLLGLAIGVFKPEIFSNILGERRTKTKAILAWGLILTFSLVAIGLNLEEVDRTTQRRITSVVDGDTVKLPTGASVRLIGIDAPERGEPYFEEAKVKLEELIEGERVLLEKDVSNTDRYGRLLRYVWKDGELINEKMVLSGYTQAAGYPPDVKYQTRLEQAQDKAQEEERGIWLDKQ